MPLLDAEEAQIDVYFDDHFDKHTVLPIKLHAGSKGPSLPPGFPKELLSKLAWKTRDFRDLEPEPRMTLSALDVQKSEMQSSMSNLLIPPTYNLIDHNIAPNKLTASDFPLPNLGKKLKQMNRTILGGPGFFVITGLEPSHFTPKENVLLQVGLCSCFGDQRAMQFNSDSGFGSALMHVVNLSDNPSPDPTDDFLLPIQDEGPIGFHNDQGDTFSLYCRKAAKQGGELYLSSGWTIYNELVTNYPDVLRTLVEPWQWQQQRRSVERPKFTKEPLIHFKDGKLVFRFMKAPLTGSEGSPRDKRLDPLTLEQLHAIKVVDEIAFKNAISVPLACGDMIFFNNLALLHARSKYVDDSDIEFKRHVTRVIVRDSLGGWEIPKLLHEQWRHWYDHDPSWELMDEMPTRTFTKDTYGLQGHG